MRIEDKKQKYLKLMHIDATKMMKAFFRMKSYESKLNDMYLNEDELKAFNDEKELIKRNMRRFMKHELL